MTYFEIIYLALTAGLLSTTVVLACFATDQLRLMRRQIDQTQQTLAIMQKQGQGWLEFKTPYAVENVEAGLKTEPRVKVWSIRMPISKSGQTPVEIVFKTMQVLPVEGFDFDEAFNNENLNPESDLNREIREDIDYSEMVGQDSGTEIASTRMGELTDRFYLLGQVVYQDSFGKQHSARGCFIYNPKLDKFFPVAREVATQKYKDKINKLRAERPKDAPPASHKSNYPNHDSPPVPK